MMQGSAGRLLGLALAATVVGVEAADAASFDCKKARTKVEKLICSTPELSSADSELGERFKAALKALGAKKVVGAGHVAALRKAQSAWLKRYRNPCEDAACLLAAYTRRNAELRATAATGGRSGSYESKDEQLFVLQVAPSTLRFQFEASYEDAYGLLCGEVTLRDGRGSFVEEDCKLDLSFGKGDELSVVQEGSCGLGAKLSAAGRYQRRDKEAPLFVECYQEEGFSR